MKAGKVLLWTLGGTVMFLGGRHLWRNAQKGSALDEAEEAKSAARLAQRLGQAFFESGPFGTGGGTNEKEVLEVFKQVSHRGFWQKVKQRYGALYPGRHLDEDLQAELRPEEHAVMLAVLQSRPESARKLRQRPKGFTNNAMFKAWAMRCYWAMNLAPGWWGSIEWREVKSVVGELPRAVHFLKLNQHYNEAFEKSLFRDLLDNLSEIQFSELKTLLMQKPDAKGKTFSELIRG